MSRLDFITFNGRADMINGNVGEPFHHRLNAHLATHGDHIQRLVPHEPDGRHKNGNPGSFISTFEQSGFVRFARMGV